MSTGSSWPARQLQRSGSQRETITPPVNGQVEVPLVAS